MAASAAFAHGGGEQLSPRREQKDRNQPRPHLPPFPSDLDGGSERETNAVLKNVAVARREHRRNSSRHKRQPAEKKKKDCKQWGQVSVSC